MATATGRVPRRADAQASGDRIGPHASRYDLLLALVPLAFLAAGAAAAVLPLGIHASLVAASLVGAGAIVDAVYRNPPIPQR